ncbi:GNAT family N-acetyltransferase [Flagellimonas marinaquae]|uniref:GNAT family N-acetyltransferase n=1 Tax=Flagellimonas marinaquae TaxID=254955 RepID=UPI0020756591|nr:GNAT family N-acetyltransferase [Allomuricauda aquimarina]USD24831.1 GNAT family N-acetyltransferase [Allomuricauda aquimarina]
MVIQNNPFTDPTYIKNWTTHYYTDRESFRFDFIKGIEFTKHDRLPLYFNVGEGKSYGMSYEFSTSSNKKDFKHKVFFIYDVLDYFKIKSTPPFKRLGVKKLFSGEGYLVQLKEHDDIDSYLNAQFNSKGRNKLKAGLKKMEKAHAISYKWYYGSISRQKFSALLEAFYKFIEMTYKDKDVKNSHQKKGVKDWYNEMLFQMINEKKASFFVIKDDEKIISVNLAYHADNVMFGAAAVSNPEYISYGMGSIAILKSIEWALENKVSYFDMSKGSFGYKHRWATKTYVSYHHIFFDKACPVSILLANSISLLYWAKQFRKKISNN